jgi:hypothetical protein
LGDPHGKDLRNELPVVFQTTPPKVACGHGSLQVVARRLKDRPHGRVALFAGTIGRCRVQEVSSVPDFVENRVKGVAGGEGRRLDQDPIAPEDADEIFSRESVVEHQCVGELWGPGRGAAVESEGERATCLVKDPAIDQYLPGHLDTAPAQDVQPFVDVVGQVQPTQEFHALNAEGVGEGSGLCDRPGRSERCAAGRRWWRVG